MVEEEVKGVVVVFCLFDLRILGRGGLCSASVGEGLDSGRMDAFLFRGLDGVFVADLGSASMLLSSAVFSGSAASLAEERVTLEDMCVNGSFRAAA